MHRLGTKVSQHPPVKAIKDATEFQQFIKPILLGPMQDLHFIINMDQTPVYFQSTQQEHLMFWAQKPLSSGQQ
jgi:hypothetical protein